MGGRAVCGRADRLLQTSSALQTSSIRHQHRLGGHQHRIGGVGVADGWEARRYIDIGGLHAGHRHRTSTTASVLILNISKKKRMRVMRAAAPES